MWSTWSSASPAGTTAAKSNAADVTCATLDNGLRVVIVLDAIAPAVTTEMKYLVGSDKVPVSFPDVAHAVKYMIFHGSPRPVEGSAGGDRGQHGGAFNADTTQAVASYYLVALAQDLRVASHVKSLRMRGWPKPRSGHCTDNSPAGRSPLRHSLAGAGSWATPAPGRPFQLQSRLQPRRDGWRQR